MWADKHYLLVAASVAFLVTLGFLHLLAPVAQHLNLVDKPGGRKQHEGSIPLIGGMAMFLGFAFAALTLPISLANYRSYLAATALLVIIGVLDDFHELRPRYRLYTQIIAGLLMAIWGGNLLYDLGDLVFLGNIHLGWFAVPFTVVAVVGTINAVNMTDGVDGLASGLCVIQFAMMAILAMIAQLLQPAHILWVIIAGSLGFVALNFPLPGRKQASVFMGDSGSMFLGFTVTWFLVELSQQPQQAFAPVTILWILAVPIFDITTVTIKRIRNKQSPFKASRDHIHHILLAMGCSRRLTTWLILFMAIILAASGALGYLFQIADGIMFLSLIIVYLIYLMFYNHQWKKLKPCQFIE
tara:strand:- start:7041 stop:8105 length:1065 start_codon:yes stop_codon:yes gene_type:complete